MPNLSELQAARGASFDVEFTGNVVTRYLQLKSELSPEEFKALLELMIYCEPKLSTNEGSTAVNDGTASPNSEGSSGSGSAGDSGSVCRRGSNRNPGGRLGRRSMMINFKSGSRVLGSTGSLVNNRPPWRPVYL